MSLPRPPKKGAILPYNDHLDEAELAAYVDLGWSPVDIRTLESSLENCRLVVAGVRMNTVALTSPQLAALELEFRANGGFSSKVRETNRPQTAPIVGDDSLALFQNIPISAGYAAAKEERMKEPKSRRGRPGHDQEAVVGTFGKKGRVFGAKDKTQRERHDDRTPTPERVKAEKTAALDAELSSAVNSIRGKG